MRKKWSSAKWVSSSRNKRRSSPACEPGDRRRHFERILVPCRKASRTASRDSPTDAFGHLRRLTVACRPDTELPDVPCARGRVVRADRHDLPIDRHPARFRDIVNWIRQSARLPSAVRETPPLPCPTGRRASAPATTGSYTNPICISGSTRIFHCSFPSAGSRREKFFRTEKSKLHLWQKNSHLIVLTK